MSDIVPQPRWSVKEKMKKRFGRCRDAGVRIRYLIIFNLWKGRSVRAAVAVLGVSITTGYRVAARFREYGEAGLWDGREGNGSSKLDADYLGLLDEIVRSRPSDYGWRRPTWTRELLVETLARKTGIRIHVSTMSRALAKIEARRGKPRPRVGCPWHPAAKTRRLNELRTLVGTLSRHEALVYEDEVDIHLNPKIGLDWMGKGQQKDVMTPGKNVKRYFAAAMDAATERLVWAKGPKKNSRLFLDLLRKLLKEYPDRKVIHVILDNYCIHSSRQTSTWLAEHGGKFRLHFLPPYSPDDNRIERKVWREVHANVTTNLRCTSIDWLCEEVVWYLMKHNRTARELCVRQSRPAI